MKIQIRFIALVFFSAAFLLTATAQTNPPAPKPKPPVSYLRHLEKIDTIETVVEKGFDPGSSASLTIYKTEDGISKKIGQNSRCC